MNKDCLIAVSMHVSNLNEELDKKQQWIEKAIPFLKSQLWTCSDALAMPPIKDGISDILQESLEKDHKILTELLTQVGALEE
jgi:hypothetical protein